MAEKIRACSACISNEICDFLVAAEKFNGRTKDILNGAFARAINEYSDESKNPLVVTRRVKIDGEQTLVRFCKPAQKGNPLAAEKAKSLCRWNLTLQAAQEVAASATQPTGK